MRALTATSGIALLMVVSALLPPGNARGPHDGLTSAGRVLGQLALLALAASLATSRARPARWLTLAHVGLGCAILALVVAHFVSLGARGIWHGWVSGALALALLGAHGAMGAMKPALLRRLGRDRWRFAHLASGLGALALSLEHALLYGRHWGLLLWLAPSA